MITRKPICLPFSTAAGMKSDVDAILAKGFLTLNFKYIRSILIKSVSRIQISFSRLFLLARSLSDFWMSFATFCTRRPLVFNSSLLRAANQSMPEAVTISHPKGYRLTEKILENVSHQKTAFFGKRLT